MLWIARVQQPLHLSDNLRPVILLADRDARLILVILDRTNSSRPSESSCNHHDDENDEPPSLELHDREE